MENYTEEPGFTPPGTGGEGLPGGGVLSLGGGSLIIVGVGLLVLFFRQWRASR